MYTTTSSYLKWLVFLLALCVGLLNAFVPPDIQKRFEYKLSFKGPHLIFKDGTIPFWEHSGSAIPSNDQIRLTPSIKSQKGRIWCKNQVASNDWEVEVALRINGRGRIGADGMAIWYTDKIGSEGSVFGSNDHWTGLGVFLDSFDNDAQQNNPYILVMTNDGTKTYDHHRDGITQQLGGCLRDFRNKPFPVRLKLEYYRRTLTVYYHAGLNNDLASYEICARVENLDLPKSGHFGVSAETGGLADDQDVLSFITHSLIDKAAPETSTLSNEEQKKYDKEYEEFMRQLEQEKEKYMKEHPEKQDEYIDEKKMFEGESDRQFRTILDVQNSMQGSLRSLDSKMAEILGRQERIVSMISNLPAAGSGGAAQHGSATGQAAIPVDTIRRDEVTHIITQQNELVKNIRDIYSSVSEVQRKTNDILAANRGGHQGAINPGSAGSQIDPTVLAQISENIRNLKTEMNSALNRNQQQVRCPEATGCLSTFYFMCIILAQSFVFLAYFLWKNRAETHLKKFY